MIKSLQRKVEKAKYYEDLFFKCEQKYLKLTKEIWNELEESFPLLLSEHTYTSKLWDSQDLDSELQMLLKSMIRGNKLIMVPGKRFDSILNFYLSPKYGLKEPRTRSPYSLLPYKDTTPVFSNHQLKEGNVLIDFSALENHHNIDSKKLNKFFYFLDKAVKLFQSFMKAKKDFQSTFKDFSVFGNLCLNKYSSLEDFEKFLSEGIKLEKPYSLYAKRVDKVMKDRDNLILELKAYNKPFRVLMALKAD